MWNVDNYGNKDILNRSVHIDFLPAKQYAHAIGIFKFNLTMVCL